MSGLFEAAQKASLRSLARRIKAKRIADYKDRPEVLEDGLTFGKRAITGIVSAALRRNPARREADVTVTDAIDGETLTVEVAGTNYSYTVQSGDTVEDAASGLATELDTNAPEVNAGTTADQVNVFGDQLADYTFSLQAGSLELDWLDSTQGGPVAVWLYPSPDQGDKNMKGWKLSTVYNFDTPDGGPGGFVYKRGNVAGSDGLYIQVLNADADVAVDAAVGIQDFDAQEADES